MQCADARLEFAFPDLEGMPASLSEPRFRKEVVNENLAKIAEETKFQSQIDHDCSAFYL